MLVGTRALVRLRFRLQEPIEERVYALLLGMMPTDALDGRIMTFNGNRNFKFGFQAFVSVAAGGYIYLHK